jgi:hypothetical protein
VQVLIHILYRISFSMSADARTPANAKHPFRKNVQVLIHQLCVKGGGVKGGGEI